MYDEETKQLLDEIADALKKAHFNPFEQMIGYVEFDNPLYITRLNGAREKILTIDKAAIKKYLEEYKNEY